MQKVRTNGEKMFRSTTRAQEHVTITFREKVGR
jgi:hypothetical protein